MKLNNILNQPANYLVSWGVKLDPVYRILSDENYLNDFFEKGNLLLSCFANFKKYKDEMQGDPKEGNMILSGKGKPGFYNHIIYESGNNSYVLCTSKNLNEQTIKDFKGVGAIKINDTVNFGREISRKLPFCQNGLEGGCIYESRSKFLDEKNEFLNNIDINTPDGQLLFSQFTNGFEIFVKPDQYKHQNEYRFFWFTNKKIESSIVVNCPEVIEYCEKIIF